MSKKYIVALDIGTSSTRALLYDTQGNMIPDHEVKAEYKQNLTPDGGVECDPDHLLDETVNALKKLLKLCSADELKNIICVATSCFWHAIMGIDSDGNAVTPLYSWADTRAFEAIPELESIFKKDDYHSKSGAFIHPCFWPAKILWLNKTNKFSEKVIQWISFPDYLALKVGGVCKTSVSIASATGLMNRQSGDWDAKILSDISLSKNQLPEIASDDAHFTSNNFKGLDALNDIPWFFALGDGACSNIGAGGTTKNRLVINVSTSGAVRFLTDQCVDQLPSGLFDYRMDSKRHVIGGAISNGGNVYAWLERTLKLDSKQNFDNILLSAKPASHGLTVLPFWAGERSPGWHASAQGSIHGLRLSTSPLDIAQASMEAIAYSIRQIRDMIMSQYPDANELIVSGGAVEGSKYMQQLLADVLNSSVRVSLDAEPSGRGAAVAASELIGEMKNICDAGDELSEVISPCLESVKMYNYGFDNYTKLYKKLIG